MSRQLWTKTSARDLQRSARERNRLWGQSRMTNSVHPCSAPPTFSPHRSYPCSRKTRESRPSQAIPNRPQPLSSSHLVSNLLWTEAVTKVSPCTSKTSRSDKFWTDCHRVVVLSVDGVCPATARRSAYLV